MAIPSITNKKRLVLLLFLSSIALLLLVFRLGWIQIVKGEKYREMAQVQQTRDIPIPAKRGIIYDRNGKELAISASTYTVWARPTEVTKSGKADDTVAKLAEILGENEEDIRKKVTRKNTSLVKVKKWIEKETADSIRKEGLKGISIAEDNRRYYPFGNFASHVIGHTTDDNMGLSGVELKYDKYLSGLPGRWIKNTDAAGRQLYYGTDKYYEAENGLNVVLTIDEIIQHFTEKALSNTLAATKAKRVFGIVMDPKTGDVLAMSVKPDYDPNDARTPLDENLKREYDVADNKEKSKIWNKMWRNPIISDTYEPGSTFKLITSAAGLEEGVVAPDSSFHSPGYIVVAGQRLKCWRYYRPHGHQSFTEGVQNSCNPVFVEVGQRLGIEKYYEYLDAFGFTNTTGIDLPGEGRAIIQNKNIIGPVELATMSYGQGISVTPLQLISAISAVGNDGKLMKPRIVKELVDDEGNVIHRYEPNMVRQVISEKTAKELSTIMESVVSDGSGKKAYIPGYRVGGKTGTADKVIDGRYAKGKTYSSFISLAPANDPKLAVLVVVDEPQGVRFGSLTAAPAVGEILKDSLRYLEVEPQFNEEEVKEYEKAEVSVPEIRNLPLKEAAQILSKNNLRYETEPMNVENSDITIIDQFPKPGAKVLENSVIILYLKKE
ncbi:stage V sporulation protein D [Anaeromicrobium sediminis]|uniref:Stage V sporulation protein D n=1 Tax=Anaeromicrobium sediminis TaxID=1478221 RepID=A0A267MJ51_9FIRM|nr:stage V sporulation protein D [Anaeromicrobium sediminis]PAB58823.1 stage V sporulation protein D [Anaeromicrobium sediminis]